MKAGYFVFNLRMSNSVKEPAVSFKDFLIISLFHVSVPSCELGRMLDGPRGLSLSQLPLEIIPLL